jgi:formate dehydrogenase gamma subunit
MRPLGKGVIPALFVAAFALVQPAVAQNGPNCPICHSNASMFRGQADSARLVVPAEAYAVSVHGSLEMSCEDCHQGLTEFPHPAEARPVACAACHASEGEEYDSSLHGYAVARGNERAPTCGDCHGVHDIRRSSDPDSRTHHSRMAATCTGCHGTGGLLTDEYLKLPAAFVQYAQSVHGRAAERGVEEAASCTDCHGIHDLRGNVDPASRINRMNVSSTCGRCHVEVRSEYERSIHGRALAAGITDSPTCNDCHGEHLILSPDDREARTYDAHQATELCGDCHNDPVIIAKYSLQEEVVGSYVDSYHGWVTRGGNGLAATCVSCHSAHLVLPKADPASTVHRDNVVATCGRCHESADLDFARSYDHLASSITRNPINRIIRTIYIVLITVVIGGMALHNLVIINYYLVEKRRAEKREGGLVFFSRSELIQHIVLAVAFIVLVISGFALRYPEAAWARFATGLGLTEAARSTVHRAAGVALILVSVWHGLYLLSVRRGRLALRGMLPQYKDFRDFAVNLRFHTWRSRERARFGRFGYPAKAEYWALIWGTVLMVFTGLVLWFPPTAVDLFPRWIVSASQTVHFYEAWLATLAILVWHFFFVIFHPDVYPMSWTWLTGSMPEHEAREHHSEWYEEETGAGLQEGQDARKV